MDDTKGAAYPQAVSIAGAVLVIDDDAAVRGALTGIMSVLTDAAVYSASSGREGLQIVQERQDVALILLDMNMPVMNGEEIYERVQQIAPETSVIISSSLSPAEARSRFGTRDMPAFLQKPYGVTALRTVIQSMVTTVA
jgi:CheY-like chemotaxis protein